ncbi:hypothetical protein MTN95_08960 [Bacillus sp. 2CMS4F]|uniref:hypothetical protein n=1 Tax=Bacillus sp. 2CMS4F TaxID=2929170 RepID=UPI0020C0A3FC|nr:hypothetical protein [Bacillus sp. 2CMS4F]MCK8099499.1 hypothetical protein [Bacillus sp. 2CMS4F]
MKTSAEEYENAIVAHEKIILLKKDVELKDILSRVHLTEKTIVRDLLNAVFCHIEIIDSGTIRIGQEIEKIFQISFNSYCICRKSAGEF